MQRESWKSEFGLIVSFPVVLEISFEIGTWVSLVCGTEGAAAVRAARVKMDSDRIVSTSSPSLLLICRSQKNRMKVCGIMIVCHVVACCAA